MALKDVVPMLNQLSVGELDQLALRVKALRGLTSATKGCEETTSDQEFILACAAKVAGQISGDSTTIFQLRETARKSPAFRAKVGPLMKFLHQACPTRSQRHSLLCLAFSLLHKDMSEGGYVITARTFLAHIHRLPAILDRHFPGYAAAGMLGWVIGERK